MRLRSNFKHAWVLAVSTVIPGVLASQAELCLPELAGLKYPPSAREQRIQGIVKISFVWDQFGKPALFESKAYPILRASVEETLLLISPRPDCSGQHASMQVNFRLGEDVAPSSGVSVRRLSSSIYEVVAPVDTVTTTISDPAWIFTRKGRLVHRVHGWFGKVKLRRASARVAG